uniref:Uncharacterized protein n=1 Tax=Anguilla anguilla TaxID=7936 RepID=A0A0E9QIJ1_ANGAN
MPENCYFIVYCFRMTACQVGNVVL